MLRAVPTTLAPVVAPTPPPLTSVIIVNFNGGNRLRQCLHTLVKECHPSVEIILVDNASTDGSAEAAEQAFPNVWVVRSAVNVGFGAGNNLGARLAIGQYLAFLNPDTVVEPGWLTALIAALEAEPQAGLATSKILLLDDPQRINACGNNIHCTGLTLCRGMGLACDALADAAEVSAVSGAAFVIRRELFERLGGFDGAFFMYMEDTDLSWRARLAGYRCIYVPASVVYHDYTLGFGPQKTFYQERNRYLLLLKGLRWRTLIILLPILLLAEVITWGFVLLRERKHLANKIRAYAWIAQHWGGVMEQRRQTQALRRIRDHELVAMCTHRLVYEQTGEDAIARLAHGLFDPAFLVLRQLALALIRW